MRADRVLVERGLAESRTRAQAAIAAGRVFADGAPVIRPGQLLRADAAIDYAPEHPWVSRGALKLLHALDLFALDVSGRRCLDIGASTGGFTEVLLSRGAIGVIAVDVGHGQLHPSLAADPRVTLLESTDARTLEPLHIAEAEVIVCDASFIGAVKVLSAPLRHAPPCADLIVLIKPQYERGPGASGRIQNEEAARVAERVAAELHGLAGFERCGLTMSPVAGGDGTPEALYWARKGQR